MRRSLIAFVVAASLSFSLAGQLNPLWTFLLSLGSESSSDEGCGADPFGCPSASGGEGFAPPPSSDEGAGWDPFG